MREKQKRESRKRKESVVKQREVEEGFVMGEHQRQGDQRANFRAGRLL